MRHRIFNLYITSKPFDVPMYSRFEHLKVFALHSGTSSLSGNDRGCMRRIQMKIGDPSEPTYDGSGDLIKTDDNLKYTHI